MCKKTENSWRFSTSRDPLMAEFLTTATPRASRRSFEMAFVSPVSIEQNVEECWSNSKKTQKDTFSWIAIPKSVWRTEYLQTSQKFTAPQNSRRISWQLVQLVAQGGKNLRSKTWIRFSCRGPQRFSLSCSFSFWLSYEAVDGWSSQWCWQTHGWSRNGYHSKVAVCIHERDAHWQLRNCCNFKQLKSTQVRASKSFPRPTMNQCQVFSEISQDQNPEKLLMQVVAQLFQRITLFLHDLKPALLQDCHWCLCSQAKSFWAQKIPKEGVTIKIFFFFFRGKKGTKIFFYRIHPNIYTVYLQNHSKNDDDPCKKPSQKNPPWIHLLFTCWSEVISESLALLRSSEFSFSSS